MNPIPDYPGYFASTEGVIYSVKSGELKPLKPHPGPKNKLVMYVTLYSPLKKYKRVNSSGYECYAMKPQSIPVYRLVLLAFHGIAPAGHQVSYVNGDKSDTRPCNVRWGPRPVAKHKRAVRPVTVENETEGQGEASPQN